MRKGLQAAKARCAQDTAIHPTERVPGPGPYRPWTLSLLLEVLSSGRGRDVLFLPEVLGIFVRALFTFRRR